MSGEIPSSIEHHQKLLTDKLASFSKTHGFPVYVVGDTINTIIIGEEHYAHNEHIFDLIRKVRPSKIIAEALGHYSYDPTSKGFTQRAERYAEGFVPFKPAAWMEVDTSQQFRKPYIELSDELQIPVVGSDLSFHESASVLWHKKRKVQLEIGSYEEYWNAIAYLYERDNQMLEILLENQGTPLNPTLAIVGYMHALELMWQRVLDNYCVIEVVDDKLREAALDRFARSKK